MSIKRLINRSLFAFFVLFAFWGVSTVYAKRAKAQIVACEVQEVNKKRSPRKVRKKDTTEVHQDSVVACNEEKPKERSLKTIRKRRKERKRSTIIDEGGKRRTLSTMHFAELKRSKDAAVASGNKEVAIKYLEKMVPQCTDMHELEVIMIELGDFYYEIASLVKAFTMYREFVNLYPGSQKVEYVLYRAIVCKFDDLRDAERDQSPTKETIQLAEEFLERSELFVTYREKVVDLLKKCQERLFENELSIFNFYLSNKRVVGAAKRLDSIKKDFVPLIPELEPRIMMLEVELAMSQNNTEFVEQKQEELITKFPDYMTQLAQAAPKKKHFSSRF